MTLGIWILIVVVALEAFIVATPYLIRAIIWVAVLPMRVQVLYWRRKANRAERALNAIQ
jgi:hypothetical protein